MARQSRHVKSSPALQTAIHPVFDTSEDELSWNQPSFLRSRHSIIPLRRITTRLPTPAEAAQEEPAAEDEEDTDLDLDSPTTANDDSGDDETYVNKPAKKRKSAPKQKKRSKSYMDIDQQPSRPHIVSYNDLRRGGPEPFDPNNPYAMPVWPIPVPPETTPPQAVPEPNFNFTPTPTPALPARTSTLLPHTPPPTSPILGEFYDHSSRVGTMSPLSGRGTTTTIPATDFGGENRAIMMEVGGFARFIRSNEEVEEENRLLRERVRVLETRLGRAEELERENEWLRERVRGLGL